MRRFYTLDAMRGVAALLVFAGHCGPLIEPFALRHFTLAVDLFFMLSGYVIEGAYAQRLASGMSAMAFMRARWIRLYPLYILGGLIGIAAALVALFVGKDTYSPSALAIAALFTALMLPSPTWQWNICLMPMNYAAWSLVFELFANLLFALFARLLTTRRLLVLCALSAVWLAYAGYLRQGLYDGVSWTGFWVAFPRVLFGFFAGVAIRRLVKERLVVTRWAYALPLVLLPLLSGMGGVPGEIVKVVLVFPFLLALAASIEPPDSRIFAALGTLSYPLYAIHVPVLQVLQRALNVLHVEQSAVAPWAGLALGVPLIVVALLLEHAYDQPVRSWLTERIRFRPAMA